MWRNLVINVIARGLSTVIGRYGPGVVSRGLKTFKRYDVSIHRSLYGQSGGRGVRHGRDAGSIIAGIYQGTRGPGETLNGQPFQPSNPPRKFNKARSGYKFKRYSRRYKCPPDYRSRR